MGNFRQEKYILHYTKIDNLSLKNEVGKSPKKRMIDSICVIKKRQHDYRKQILYLSSAIPAKNQVLWFSENK